MSEELLQRDLHKNPEKIGKWDFYNIGATTIKALKEYSIIRNVNYGKEERKKVDALIVQHKNVLVVIEYKKPSEFKTKDQKDKAIEQEIEVAKKIGAHIIIATDTKESVWVNVETGNRIKDENGEELKYNFNPKDEKLPKLIEKIIASINEISDQIKPSKLVNPTGLAKQVWQDIWAVSGATPENCLYTFVELFIFKYLSDLGILSQGINFDHLQERYGYAIPNPEEEALEYYANTIRPQIKKLFPEGVDSTTIINGTIFVSKDQKAVRGYSTVFKKVLGKFRDYGKLEYIDKDFKSQLFESFLKESISKKNWGQFFTPLKVIRAITKMAKDDITAGVKICDPACGVGKFLLEPIFMKLDQFYEVKDGQITSKITIRGYDKGFDQDEQKTIILAKANMLIYFSELLKENPNITKEFADLFNESFILKTNSILGTLSVAVESEYDLILTNPPYVTSGSSNLKEEIKKDSELTNYFKVNGIGIEGLFMEWIVRALKPNGKAFVVVPNGIFNRQHDKNLRNFILEECFIDGIISLPPNTFFTTNKKTYILCLTKKNDSSDVQTEPVFTYLVSEIGESRDIYRFDIDQNDLDEAVILYNFFKGNKSEFKKFYNNPRCKVFPIDKLESDTHWSIDRWWSKEAKIELGIEEEDRSIKLEELPYFIEEIANNIVGFKNEILELNEKKNFGVEYQDFLISDIFHLAPIKGLTKSFINQNKGDIPVYGGKINETPIGYISDNLNQVKYFENCLAWNREGSVGYVFWHKHKFTTNDHHRPMILKDNYTALVDLEYARHEIEKVLLSQGFQWSQTASKEKVAQLTFRLPVKNNQIDLKTQQEISQKYQKVEQMKSSIQEELSKIETMDIEY